MGISERRAREKASLRRDILDAARQLFLEEGYERVTMRRVAEKIEYSPTTIYLHFEDKDDLLNAVCEETFARLVVRLEKVTARHEDPVEALRAGLKEYVEFGLKHPGHYKLTFVDGPREGSRLSYQGSIGQRAFQFLVNGVRACVDSRAFRAVDVAATSQALWAACHGLVSLLSAHTGFPWVARRTLIDHTIDTMLNGLRAR